MHLWPEVVCPVRTWDVGGTNTLQVTCILAHLTYEQVRRDKSHHKTGIVGHISGQAICVVQKENMPP